MRFAAISALIASLSVLVLPALTLPGTGAVAAAFPPWWNARQVLEGASAAGSVVRFGTVPFVVVLMLDPDRGVADLVRSGAWLLADPQWVGGCAGSS